MLYEWDRNLRVLVTGDLHISEHAWAGRPWIKGDARFALEELIRVVDEHSIDHVVLLGDLFDSNQPSVIDLLNMKWFCKELSNRIVTYTYLQGQHDRNVSGVPWMKLWQVPSAESRWKLDNYDLVFTGCDYQPANKLAETLAAKTLTNLGLGFDQILLTHQPWAELLPPQAAAPSKIADLVRTPMLWTGDNHAHKYFTVAATSGQRIDVWSPGSVFMQSIDEDPEKKVFVFEFPYIRNYDLSMIENCQWESVPIRSRPVLKTTIRSECELNDFCRQIGSYRSPSELPPDVALPLSIVKLPPNVEQCLPHAKNRIEQIADVTDAHVIFKTISDKSAQAPEPISVPVKNSTQEVVYAALSQRTANNETLAKTAGRLLEALSPDKELQLLTNEWMTAVDARPAIPSKTTTCTLKN